MICKQHETLMMELCLLSRRIHKLLRPARPHRVVTGDSVRHSLAFMETEISFIVVFLKRLEKKMQHFNINWLAWVVGFCTQFLRMANNAFREIDPSRHPLQRAAQCFCLTYHMIKNLYITVETPCRYPHLILASSDLGVTPQLSMAGALPLVGIDRPAKKVLRWLTPQLSKAGALPFVGIDRPVKKVLRWLTHQGMMDKSLRVMSIVGPLGIGKTTLAMEVRNRLRQHETIDGRYFQCNVMVQTSSQGTDRNILLLQDILSQVSEPAATALSSDPSQTKTMEVLLRLISECLQDKRYFIVIDDICQESDWQKIKGAFPITNNGSGILITTRVTSIGEACCSGSYYGLVHKMKPLNQIQSEMLLLSKAVVSAESCLPDNLKLLSDEILRRCDGIPLFLTVMADWLKEQRLQKQQQQRQREDGDKEHQRFAIHLEEQVPCLPERLEQALSSAFNDLPYGDLRSLSLYMGMFQYGYKFDKDRLISKWIQEGHLFWSLCRMAMVPSKATKIAETFFSQLVDRNVITCVASKCKHMEDEAEACQWQINHFMQQFLVSKSAEMGFVFTTATLKLLAAASPATGHGNEPSIWKPHRLALHHPDPQLPSLFKKMDLLQTRSLAVSSGTVCKIPLDKFVNLVVLDFQGWENLKDNDLLQVCKSKMFFLTYLNISNTQVSKLPKEIKELQILETLDISYTQITELPLEVCELSFLRHLDLRGTRISELPKQIVGLRYTLVGLLVGDQGSMETAARVPNDVRRLFHLQTLATVDLTEHPASFVRALGDLHDLRVLAVTWSFHQSTDRDYCEALLSSIVKWKKLESLTIHSGLGCSMEFLGSLEKSQVPQNLEKFKVTAGRFASVPPWIQWGARSRGSIIGLEHLAFVQITVCNKQTTKDDLKTLGDLPKLMCLILGLDFIPGQAIEIENQGFRELQRFSVDCPMPWLTFKAGAMWKLTYLQLKLRPFPESSTQVPSGIGNLPSVNEVALCYNLRHANNPYVKETVRAVREAVAEHLNQVDLFINNTQDYDVQAVHEVTENTATGTLSSTDAGDR